MKDVLFFRGRNASQVDALMARDEAASEVEKQLRTWLRTRAKGVPIPRAADMFVKTTIRALRISMENETHG